MIMSLVFHRFPSTTVGIQFSYEIRTHENTSIHFYGTFVGSGPSEYALPCVVYYPKICDFRVNEKSKKSFRPCRQRPCTNRYLLPINTTRCVCVQYLIRSRLQIRIRNGTPTRPENDGDGKGGGDSCGPFKPRNRPSQYGRPTLYVYRHKGYNDDCAFGLWCLPIGCECTHSQDTRYNINVDTPAHSVSVVQRWRFVHGLSEYNAKRRLFGARRLFSENTDNDWNPFTCLRRK